MTDDDFETQFYRTLDKVRDYKPADPDMADIINRLCEMLIDMFDLYKRTKSNNEFIAGCERESATLQ